MNFTPPEIANLRNVIKRIARAVVDEMRPAYRYAQVVSWDTTAYTAIVVYPDSPNMQVTVGMGTILPTAAGQWVRIEGMPGDRFIADIMLGMQ